MMIIKKLKDNLLLPKLVDKIMLRKNVGLNNIVLKAAVLYP
jgi:hypothetical protein